MKKILSNFMYQASYQLLLIILPIITIPIVSRALGPDGLGTWNFVSSIVNYFVLLAGLGLANYAVREIAYVKDDRAKLSEKFWEIQIFNMFFSGTVLIAYLIICIFLPNRIFFLIQGLIVFATLLDISWFYQGIEDFKQIATQNFIIKILAFIAIILFVKDSSDLVVYFFINSISGVLSNTIFWIAIRKKIDFVKIKLSAAWRHFLPALNFFVLKISATLFNNVNKTLLGIFASVSAVGIFSNSLTIIVMVGTIVNTLNTVMLPRMSNLQKSNDEKQFIKLLESTIHLQLFFTIAIMFGIIAINDKMVGWFFGEGFEQVKYLVPILAPVMVFQSLHQGIANQYLVPKNRMLSYNVTMIVGTVINIALGFLLIPHYGAIGAAISYLIGQIVLGGGRSFVLVRESIFRFNWRKIFSYFISGSIMLTVVYVSTKSLPSSIFTTALQCVIGVVVYMFITSVLKVNPITELFMSKHISRRDN